MSKELKCNSLGVRARGQRRRCSQSIKNPENCEFKTVQSDKKRACIHHIMERARSSGHLPQSSRVPLPDTLPHVHDFQAAMNVIVESTQLFESLPSNVREKFANSPENFLKFVGNPENASEMYALGLAVKAPEPTPVRVEMVNLPENKPAEKPAAQ